MAAKRGEYGGGSKRETPPGSGRWRLVVAAGTDPATGKRRQLSRTFYGTRTEATRALAEFTNEVGHRPQTSSVTVGEMLRAFMREAQLAATTRADYERVIASILEPRLGKMPVHKVTPPVLDRTWSEVGGAGVSAHRIARSHTVLSAAFRQAIRRGWVHTNPARAAPPRSPERPAVRSPGSSTLKALLAAVADDPDLYAWLRLSVVTGARRGEVLGLRWEDVDFDSARLTIRRSVSYTPTSGVTIKGTKTNRERVVALDPQTLEVLRVLQGARRSAASIAGLPFPDAGYVLTFDPAGLVPWRPDLATHRFGRIRSRVPGADKYRLHDLRHAAASLLLAAGHDLRTVADRLGHARPSVTLEIYAATLPESERAAARTMGDLLDGG